ncbi:hypothetical protein FQZ97_1014070 [compost metagenome]
MLAIDGAEVAVSVGPLVPDADAVVLQPGDVGLAAQEPQQFDEDRPRVQFLRRQQREALGQVKAHLATEHAQGAGAGAVVAPHAVFEDVPQQVQILPLGMVGRRGRRAGFEIGEGDCGVHIVRMPLIRGGRQRSDSLAHRKGGSQVAADPDVRLGRPSCRTV